MSIRKKVVAIIGAVVAVSMIVGFPLFYPLIMGGFSRLEDQEMRTNVERITGALDYFSGQLGSS